MDYSIEGAADAIDAKPDVIRRAVELGAIRLTDGGLITISELSAFVAEGFKHNRYDQRGNKLAGARS